MQEIKRYDLAPNQFAYWAIRNPRRLRIEAGLLQSEEDTSNAKFYTTS